MMQAEILQSYISYDHSAVWDFLNTSLNDFIWQWFQSGILWYVLWEKVRRFHLHVEQLIKYIQKCFLSLF